MRQDDFCHRGRGLDCQALSAHRFLVRLRARIGSCRRVYVTYCLNKYEWTRGRKKAEMEVALRDSAYLYYQCVLEGEDNRLAYIFEIEGEDGRWYLSEEGLSRAYDHDLAYFNFFQYCFVHACDLFRPVSWAGSACVYQIFPERFFNGMGEKAYVDTPWDAEPTPRSFCGGDLVGVREKLGYLADLGVNCLYLTPVFPSPSNHKYDITDYRAVDASFGGPDALRRLVEDAHARGMRVLLDGVFNHCSSKHPFFQDVVRNGRRSPYHDWFFIEGDRPDERRGNYSMFASVRDMPRLNTGNPAVIDYFTETAAWWIREFDTDGWRLDVCDEISERFLRTLRERVKAAKSEAVILGEIWHDGAPWLRGDMLDGVMNYSFTKACWEYVAAGTLDAQGFCDRVARVLWRVPGAASQMALNLLGSHDTERFLQRCHGDKRLVRMGYAAAFLMPGMPCVYYGDEVGVTGGYDPGCRRGFPWDEARQDRELRAFIRALCALKKEPALSAGSLRVFVEEGMAVLERRAPEQTVRLYMNRTAAPQKCAWGGEVPAGECRLFIQAKGEGARALSCK